MVLSVCSLIVAKMLYMNRRWKERPISEVLQLSINKRSGSSSRKRKKIKLCTEEERPFREPSEIAEDIASPLERPSKVLRSASVVDPAPVITITWSNWNLSFAKILQYSVDHMKRTCAACWHATVQPLPDDLWCLDSGFIQPHQPLSPSHMVEKFTTEISTENLNQTLKTAQTLTNSAEAFDPAYGSKFADDIPVEAAQTCKSDERAPIKGSPQRIICLHLTLFPASSTVTPTISISS
ncbi:uncharacterized protein [Paralichthys olivaceus]|uniref:uncharacterized protein n=1 Tax=Paralichthys olivaceus TaxID=8255 RepID=UPI003750283C